MFSVQMRIALTEAQAAIGEGTLTEKLKVAMHITRNHWLCTDKEEQFQAAIGAVMLHYGEGSDEFARLQDEIKSLRQISVMINAAQAGLSVTLDSIKANDNEVIGLMQLWRETRTA